MNGTLFGIPSIIPGLICAGLAVVWLFLWPKDKDSAQARQRPNYRPRPASAQFVLRWFHALVWLLLAVACFAWGGGLDSLASIAAVVAGVTYLIFISAVIKEGQRRKAFES